MKARSLRRGLAASALLFPLACQRQGSSARDTNRSPARPGAGSARVPGSLDSSRFPELSPVTAQEIPRDVALACDSATAILRAAADSNPHREDGAFDDSFGGIRRIGCRLTIRTQSTDSPSEPSTPVKILFARHGWGQDLRYSADGPDGSDIGMRRRDMLCLLITRLNGGDDEDTTSHAPQPGDNTLSLIVECARDVPSNADAGVPDSLWRIATAQGIDSVGELPVAALNVAERIGANFYSLTRARESIRVRSALGRRKSSSVQRARSARGSHREDAPDMSYSILVGTFVAVASIVLLKYSVIYRGFLSGYRGAVGVKNLSGIPILTVRIRGFRRSWTAANIAPGGHSFSFVDRQPFPEAVEIEWRTATDAVDQRARLRLSEIPRDLKDGELFCVLTPELTWNMEWDRIFRLDRLNR